MNKGLSIIFFVVVFFLFIITLILLSMAASAITKADNYKTDGALQTAHTYLVWTVVLMWIAIAILVVATILGFIYGQKHIIALGGSSGVANILTIIVMVMLLITGFLAAMAAGAINSTANGKTGSGKDAYNECIWATVISFLLVAIFVAGYIVKHTVKSKNPQTKEEVAQQKTTTTTKTEKELQNTCRTKFRRNMSEDEWKYCEEWSAKAEQERREWFAKWESPEMSAKRRQDQLALEESLRQQGYVPPDSERGYGSAALDVFGAIIR